MVPHKSCKYMAILNLSFSLQVFGVEIPLVNNSTTITAPQHSMGQLGLGLPCLIEAVVDAPFDQGSLIFF